MRIRSTDILFGLPALELRRLLQRVDAWDGFDVETVREVAPMSRNAAKLLLADLSAARGDACPDSVLSAFAALLMPAATPPDQLARRRSAKMLATSAMFSFPQMHSGTSASARLRPSGVSA